MPKKVFTVKTKPKKCLSCGSKNVFQIMYGLADEYVFKYFQEKRKIDFIIGGCIVTGYDPEWGCTDCNAYYFWKGHSGKELGVNKNEKYQQALHKDTVERLQRIAKAQTTAEQRLKEIIQKSLKKEPQAFKRIIEGESNEVYEVALKNAENVILRIAHEKGDNFEAETWAMRKAGKAGVPVANVLAIGEIKDGKRTLRYSIQEKLPGRRLFDIVREDTVDPKALKKVVEQAGAILARLHQVKTTGWGLLNKEGKGEFTTIKPWMQEKLDQKAFYLDLCDKHSLLSPAAVEQMFEELEEVPSIFQKEPNLLHQDFLPEHIFVKDGKISGIIDFGFVASGDLATDFATWENSAGAKLPVKWLINGYKKEKDPGKSFEKRVRLALLRKLLINLYYYTEDRPFPEFAQRTALSIQRLLAR